MLEYQITTQPTVEPITLDEAKLNLKVYCDADDTLIAARISAARRACEQYENRAYITQTITAKTFYLPSEIILPLPLLQSVTSIAYIDTAGDEQTLLSDLYDVDTYREPGRVTKAYNATYPSIRGDINGVTIIYKAGYGDTAADVPPETKQAIQLMIAHMDVNRVGVTEDKMYEIPWGIKPLLNKRVKTV
jgi:uncharacterized phiE125 gp8 family phage protein